MFVHRQLRHHAARDAASTSLLPHDRLTRRMLMPVVRVPSASLRIVPPIPSPRPAVDADELQKRFLPAPPLQQRALRHLIVPHPHPTQLPHAADDEQQQHNAHHPRRHHLDQHPVADAVQVVVGAARAQGRVFGGEHGGGGGGELDHEARHVLLRLGPRLPRLKHDVHAGGAHLEVVRARVFVAAAASGAGDGEEDAALRVGRHQDQLVVVAHEVVEDVDLQGAGGAGGPGGADVVAADVAGRHRGSRVRQLHQVAHRERAGHCADGLTDAEQRGGGDHRP
mmetsp:Transcript_36255/g.64874  ORF Transcript_36255/g.64874 Transcript_36255/m.64874 type:complete len:281 (+) Transcript_36255:600-1442(+)